MMNNLFNMLSPQLQQNAQNIFQQAQASGNPQQYMDRQVGYDPIYQQGIKILNNQGFEALNQFINEQKRNFPAIFR